MPITRLSGIMMILAMGLAPIGAFAHGQRAPGKDIVLKLATEGWVETETAEVIVAVNATLQQGAAATVRRTILDALGRLAPDASWRITDFNRSAERSGLDSWYVRAQARITDTALDDLRRRAEEASKPGLQINVAAINFTPTLAEMEATRARLRQELYASAQAELKRVNQAFADTPYDIGLINFTRRPVPLPGRSMLMEARAPAATEREAASIAVEDRIRLQATVILTAGESGTASSE